MPSAATGRPVHVAGQLEGVDAERLAAVVFNQGAPGVGAAATGDLTLSWPRGQPREVTGRMELELAARADGRTPALGPFRLVGENGDQAGGDGGSPHAGLEALFDGRSSPIDRTDLRLDAESTDLTAADDLLRRLRRALGNAAAEVVGLSGSGVFRGHWRGTLEAPLFEGRFTGHDLVWRRCRLGRGQRRGLPLRGAPSRHVRFSCAAARARSSSTVASRRASSA